MSGTAVYVSAHAAETHAAQSAAVRALLAATVSRALPSEDTLYVDVGGEGGTLPPETTSEYGKPYPDGIATPHGVRQVGLSHTQGFIAVAVAETAVGVDIQAPIDAQRAARVARKLHERERTLFLQRPAAVWAAKESVLKLTGEGLSRALDSFFLLPDGEFGYRTQLGEKRVTVRLWETENWACAAARFAAGGKILDFEG